MTTGPVLRRPSARCVPRASAAPGGGRKRRRRIHRHGTVPARPTCRYMGCLGCRTRARPGSERVRGDVSVSAQDEVAEFAALLRELKERTDRSYGSLARRLNMNTSTLHRYCAGEAVPVDFAPVERFAALCGASGTERVELHRRWLRAAEARRHPRGPDGGSAGAAGGAPTGPVPGPGPAAGPRSMPAWSSDVAVGASDAGRAGAGAGESAPQGGPVAEGGAVGGTRAAEAGGRRPWYRRRERVGVAVAAVCALLADRKSVV